MKDDKYAKKENAEKERYIIPVVPHLDGLPDVCAHMHACAHTCTTCCGTAISNI